MLLCEFYDNSARIILSYRRENRVEIRVTFRRRLKTVREEGSVATTLSNPSNERTRKPPSRDQDYGSWLAGSSSTRRILYLPGKPTTSFYPPSIITPVCIKATNYVTSLKILRTFFLSFVRFFSFSPSFLHSFCRSNQEFIKRRILRNVRKPTPNGNRSGFNSKWRTRMQVV